MWSVVEYVTVGKVANMVLVQEANIAINKPFQQKLEALEVFSV
jgi:hypothetical protein